MPQSIFVYLDSEFMIAFTLLSPKGYVRSDDKDIKINSGAGGEIGAWRFDFPFHLSSILP